MLLMWAELQSARDRANDISKKIERLLKEQSSLSKSEIAKYSDRLLIDVDASLEEIEKEYKEMVKYIENHRKALRAKSTFLRRHNSRDKH